MKSLNKILALLFLAMFSVSSFSCELNTSPRVCTDDLRIISVKVLTMDEKPVVLDQVKVTNLETGKVVEICDDVLGNCEKGAPAVYAEQGIYTIFHDGIRDKISGEKSTILVEGNNEKVNFQEEFLIGDNGCHVYKEAGPDTVFVKVK